MVTINVKSESNEPEAIEKFLHYGFEEEKKKIKFALEVSKKQILLFEEQYGIETQEFIEKFQKGEVEENQDTFDWWAEQKIADELRKNLFTLKSIEICPQ